MCYVHIDIQISRIFPIILRIWKYRQAQQPKKHSLRLLIATAFRYHHCECFCSQIDLTELTIVKGEPDNNLNKKCVCLLNAAPKKCSKKAVFFFKNTQKSRTSVPFCLKCTFLCFLLKLPLFSRLVYVSHIKWRPAALKWISFAFSHLICFRLTTTTDCVIDCDCFHRRFSLTLSSKYLHDYLWVT